MIHLFENGSTPNEYLAKIGDIVRLPVRADWTVQGEIYSSRVDKVVSKNCVPEIQSEIKGRIKLFDCTHKGRFKFRVKSHDSKGEKQFAIFIDGKQLGKTFRKRANTLPEYVSKIVGHYNKLNSWSCSSNGNVIEFQQLDECDNCGKLIEIRLGNYNLTNSNNPQIIATFAATEEVTGNKCYNILVKNILPGNKFIVNGITYIATDSDTNETMKAKILDSAEYLCILNTSAISISAEPGLKTVLNLNSPTLKAVYVDSTATHDRYYVNSYDVRQGNLFNINGTEKIAGQNDTQSTIDAFFNSVGGYFELPIGENLVITVLTGSRTVSNSNTPEITADLVSTTATSDMDRYSVSIYPDVAQGNVFTLDNKEYTAQTNDTDIDVAYGLSGFNTTSFNYYVQEGATVTAYASKGYKINSDNIADVELLCQVVTCCTKNSMVLEFEAIESGCYQVVMMDKYGHDTAFSSVIRVKENVEGEEVFFNNLYDAYGFEFDKLEWFRVRIPIFLQDWNQKTTEEINESISGSQVRGKTTIQKQRYFVTSPMDFDLHNYIIRVLKCENVKINNEQYTFFGEYELEEKRQGIRDLRSARGLLTENGNIASNLKNCFIGC